MRYLVLAAAVCATTASATENLMADALKVTIAQSGFAGVTGTTYEVDALANFTVTEFVNDQVTQEAADVLPPEAFSSLQNLLNGNFESSNAAAPEINPMTITVNYQGQEWVVSMTAPDDPKMPLPDVTPQGEAVRELASWITTQAEAVGLE